MIKKLSLYFYIFFIGLLFFLPKPGLSLSDEGFETLNIFTRILYYVEKDYVEDVDEKKMLQGAIRGMLSVLDPHTVYLSPQVYRHLKADTSGIFGGVGLEITIRDGWVTVVAALEGTPAYLSGIRSGDRILKIDGKSTKGMDLGTAVKDMRGKRGSRVLLTISRKGSDRPFDVAVVRRSIRAPSVQAELLEKKYLYLKMSSFQERTAQDMEREIKKHWKHVKETGMILDLRNNPGGLLEQAVRISDLFLDSGVIVTTASKKGEIDRREAYPEEEDSVKFPLIVLVNGGSASAAEIVAGALQDHERALLVGTQTFGKGSVQSVVELDDGSALKMTIARYFTPKGKSIQADGVHPDVVVEPAAVAQAGTQGKLRLREEFLEGHLEGGEHKGVEDENVFDNQKKVALDYLKSWDVFQSQKKSKK